MKRFVLVFFALVIIAQFIQPTKNNGLAMQASDITHVVQVPDSVLAMLRRSCYDCHSNHTDYPWYNYITPVNWWLRHHINEGKRELNFSTFKEYSLRRQRKKLEEIEEQIEQKEMPLTSYTLIHKYARLSDDQRKMITKWTKAALQQITQDSSQLEH